MYAKYSSRNSRPVSQELPTQEKEHRGEKPEKEE